VPRGSAVPDDEHFDTLLLTTTKRPERPPSGIPEGPSFARICVPGYFGLISYAIIRIRSNRYAP
jgi:hypothetical protein